MERKPTFLRRPAAIVALLALTVAVPLAGVLSGCGGGGSSATVIGTGFPLGPGPNTLTTPSASGTGSLQLTAANLTQAVFFTPPAGVSDTDARLQNPVTPPKGSLTFVKGTAYQTQSGVSFTAPLIMRINYSVPAGVDPATFVRTLNVYVYDDNTKAFVPVAPSAGGFTTTPGAITTTISAFQGSGLYAVMSATPPPPPAS